MILEFDIDRSIDKQKLVPSSIFSNFITYFFSILFFIVFLFCTHGLLEEENYKPSFLFILGNGLILIFSIVTFAYKISIMDKLKRIEGIDKPKNKTIIEKIAKGNDWEIVNDDIDIMIIKIITELGGNRQLTIIFDGNDILTNVFSFGKGDFKSAIYFYQNKITLDSFLSSFNNEIKNVA